MQSMRIPVVILAVALAIVFRAENGHTQPNLTDPNGFAWQVIDLTNRERSARGLMPLRCNSRLMQAALWMAQDMADHDYFGHTDSLNRDSRARVLAFNYEYSYVAENIGAGYSTPEAVFDGWMNSPSHRASILSAQVTEIGVGYGMKTTSTYTHYWTMTVADPMRTQALTVSAGTHRVFLPAIFNGVARCAP